MKRLLWIALLIILTIGIKLSPLGDIIFWGIVVIVYIAPALTIHTEKIKIVKKTKTKIGTKTYSSIQTKDKRTLINMDDYDIPIKRNSDKLQQVLKTGQTYTIKTYRPWLFLNYRNILSVKKNEKHNANFGN